MVTIPAADGLGEMERRLNKFLLRHKIGRRDFENTPKIGDIILRAIGGKQKAIDKLKFSRHSEAVKLLEFCSKLARRTREDIPIEALCLAAGVDPTTIAGALVMAARDISRLESSLITLEKHPDVVRATAFYAGLADNSRDREMFHKAAVVGWLPSPKGSSINLNFGPAPDDDPDDNSAPDFNVVFGSDPMEIEQWGEARRKLLESGK